MKPCPRRIRILLDQQYIVDTIEARYVWERDDPFYPQYVHPPNLETPHLISLPDTDIRYYIPTKDVKVSHFPSAKADSSSDFTLLGRKSSEVEAVLFHKDPLKDLIRFDFGAMDAWYEEDTEIYVHPKDPHVRVDVLPSTREVRVEIDGTQVAKSDNVMMLFETGLPTRYYLPQTSVCTRWLDQIGKDDL